ncbi:MAG: DUF1800 family protein [Ilumatobacter sp.]|jgi:uncharacterized protein (DUF1800 family)|uniref:DUF1800 family protein n=1 Tax=Ilumatobacter sp. TaxID=1967498 RepID=UPI001D340377|nr:DUF1800 family protein [Ilumatobacter sp.]MBT5277502.1 DUF1800 family protein [Ilumatobacter sp.]MBT5553976.1 DUF1800 family protein [Ilumatobacter sp.]MBT5866735.1 DUF1800 family protein [Ilumatobacter sp.]MBT7429147.1 DUF1800 family protein [Ilumatobacter sp.]
MNQQRAVGWLHRRAGLGLHPDDLAAAVARGAAAELAAISAPPTELADPWAGLELDPQDGGRAEAVLAWIGALHGSTQPFQDRRTLLLHGWLVSAIDKVTIPELMVEQIRLFMNHGGDSFPDLLRSITTNPAMLVYLDGRTSTAEAPNENYGRELLELFALGVGHYNEDDVQSAARALTGWIVRREDNLAQFVLRRHDATPQTLLGVAGVDDVDSVIGAVVDHERHATFVATRIMREYLGELTGSAASDVIEALRSAYLDGDQRLDPVIVRALELGLEDLGGPHEMGSMVLAPIPWLMICARATGVGLRALQRGSSGAFRDMGQVPLLPPGVAGWPAGIEWLTSSAVVARTRLAATIAETTDQSEPLAIAMSDEDFDLAAQHLGLGDSFTTSTMSAIRSTTDPAARLAIALVSPENLLA